MQKLEKCCEKIKEAGILLKTNKKLYRKNSNLEKVLNDNLPSDITALRVLPSLLADKDETSYIRFIQ